MSGSKGSQLCTSLFLLLVFFGGRVATTDVATLLEFKLGITAGDGTSGRAVLDTWNEAVDPCTWQKVEWETPTHPCEIVAGLNLTNLGLSGHLPDSLGTLQGLLKLDLSNNAFDGGIATGIGNSSGLTWLDLSINHLSGPIPVELSKLHNLQVLRLSKNALVSEIPDDLKILEDITELDLSGNSLIGSIPSWIADLQYLHTLNLNANNLTGSIPEHLGNSTNLEFLDLSYNQLSGNISGGLCSGGNLTRMDLSHNSLEGFIPTEINSCKNLLRLQLGTNHLIGTLPSGLGQLPMLEYLDLGGNRLEGEIPGQLGSLPVLQSLILEGNQFNGSIPSGLQTLQTLRYLNLANNSLSGAIPPSLFNNAQLLTLQLSHNKLNGSVPSNVNNMTFLENLCLCSNQLSGGVPSTIGGLSRLLLADLSNNAFSGSIPPEVGNLQSLYRMDLSRNHLTGELPTTLGKLTKLNDLDLSDNMLSGPVPSDLTLMSSLIRLDLSNNSLTGQLPLFRIPDLGQFNFDGNQGLCSNPGLSLNNTTLHQCTQAAHSAPEARSNLSKRIGRDFGFAITGLIFVVASTLAFVWLYRRMNSISGLRSAVIDPALPVVGSFFTNVYDRDGVNFEELVQNSVIKENLVSVNRFTTLYRAANREGVYPDLNVKGLRVDKPIVDHYRKHSLELEKALQREYLVHQNIMRPLGFILHDDSLYLLHEHVPNGVLRHRLSSEYDKMNWAVRYNIAVGVAQAVAYVHDGGRTPVIHLDITSGNIFLNSSLEPLVGDAELGEVIEPSKTHKSISTVAGSIGYIAPEYAFTMQVTKKSNVYSYGVVLLEILTGRYPTDDLFGNGLDLVGWVRSAPSRGETAEQILDSSVSTESFPVRQQMLAVLKVALRCTDPSPLQRPEMGTIVEMLQRAGLQPQSQGDGTRANHGRE